MSDDVEETSEDNVEHPKISEIAARDQNATSDIVCDDVNINKNYL